MSNSRLEKFIYAICGMEVDDLPTPLSRIETLWNCLITGETPDFEPLSRNEKYLMAMLNDNVDGLPEPTSRSEKLLYKIATGETDLSDVPGYLSRYEELLKYLIENGGIGGTDFEYVLYTLNQPLSTLYSTAEAPVKSAILKGQTLVNLFEKTGVNVSNPPYLTVNGSITQLKANTVYTIKYFNLPIEKVKQLRVVERHGDYNDTPYVVSEIGKFTTKTDFSDFNRLIIQVIENENGSISEEELSRVKIALIEGDYTNVDIPYFEGMQSVKMPVLTTTGKNLFHGIMTSGQLLSNNVIQNNQTKMGYSEFLPVNEELDIYCSFYTNSVYIIEKIYFYDENKNQISSVIRPTKVTTPKGTKYFRISITTTDWNSNVVFDDIKDDFNIQVEAGTQATPYEPYKSNILTTTSKNLFDMNRPYDVITDSQATVVQDTNQITVSSAESGIYVNANFILDKDFFAGKTVTGSCLYESDENDIGTVQITYQDGNGEHHYQWIRTPRTFTFPNSFIGDVMLSVSANNTDTPQSNTVTVKNIQLELGSTVTPYEPYSEVVLRGIGDVKDTLDGNTGELTQRIGEVVFDGSENWLTALSGDGFYRHYYKESTIGVGNVIADHTFTNLKNIQAINNNTILNKVGTHGEVNGYIYVGTHLNVSEFKNFLSTNPLIIQYPLSEKTNKTVGLSITDQDGQPTKLSTFNDITHVSIEAEDLLPTVDLEVPTKIEETLSTLPTLMNDISETQQLLNERIDDQAESINEVSTAITEIRSDIL